MINGSVSGLKAELASLQPGELATRVMRCPAPDAATRFRPFSQSVASVASKAPGTFTSVAIDSLVDEGRSAVRCLVITRLS